MAELRWNPLIKDWVIIASNRQDRPQMPEDWCPFCPGSDKIPDEYDVMMYENDFPALSQNPPNPDDVATDFFKVKDAYGKCEVILYSSNHTATLPELSTEHITRLVDLWCNRYEEISADEKSNMCSYLKIVATSLVLQCRTLTDRYTDIPLYRRKLNLSLIR